MNKKMMIVGLAAFAGLLSGCVTDQGAESSTVTMAAASEKFDGPFNKGEMSVRSGPCPSLSWGSVSISNGHVAGNIAAGNWSFRVSGFVDDAGVFHQLRASGSAADVTLTGKFTDPKTAGGEWASFGNASCSGTWKLLRS